VELYSSDGQTVGTPLAIELGPNEQHQVNDVVRRIGGQGATLRSGRAVVRFDRRGGIAYVSKIDRRTNDPSTLLSQCSSSFFVPAVADVMGVGGSRWKTDLQIQPTVASLPLTLDLSLYPQRLTHAVELPAGAPTVDLSDLFGVMGASPGVGMLHVVSTQDVCVTNRVYSEDSYGTRGQGIPVVEPGRQGWPETLTQGESGHLVGLREDSSFRTNISVQNFGSLPATVELQAFDSAGRPLGDPSVVELGPFDFVQLNRFLVGATGSADVPLARVTLRCLEGDHIGAYASLVDNQTNDGSLLPLLATE
jgi:hypothetical protein